MKILYVTHRDITNPRSGGAEIYAQIFLEYFSSQGHSIDIVTSRFGGQTKYQKIGNINIFRFKGYIGPHLALPFIALSKKYDIIISDLGHVVPWPILILKKSVLINIFYHLHKRTLSGQVGKFTRKFLTITEEFYSTLYRNSFFVTISTTSMNDLLELGINKDRIKLIKPGVNLKFFIPGKKSETPQLVYFSGLREYKRPYFAVDVLKTLLSKYCELNLVITGEGPSLPKIKNLVKERNLEGNVKFMGKIQRDQLSKLISESHVNLQFSIAEGFGITAIEASACGTPTVSFKTTGVVDAIEEGENGFLVNDGDLNEFIKKVDIILQDYEKWPEKCIKVAKKFSNDIEGLSWLNLVESIYKLNSM